MIVEVACAIGLLSSIRVSFAHGRHVSTRVAPVVLVGPVDNVGLGRLLAGSKEIDLVSVISDLTIAVLLLARLVASLRTRQKTEGLNVPSNLVLLQELLPILESLALSKPKF